MGGPPHNFRSAVAEFEGSAQPVAYCPRCTLIVPVGAHFLQACVPGRAPPGANPELFPPPREVR